MTSKAPPPEGHHSSGRTTRLSTGVSHFIHPQNHHSGFIRPPQRIIHPSGQGSTTHRRNSRPRPHSTPLPPRWLPPPVSQTLSPKMMSQPLTRCGQYGRVTPPLRTLCPLPPRQTPSPSDAPLRTTQLVWTPMERVLPPNPPPKLPPTLTSRRRNPTGADVSNLPLLSGNRQ